MAGEEGHWNVVVLEDVDRCGRKSPWCFWVDCCYWGISFKLLKPSASDHCNLDGSWIGVTRVEFEGRVLRIYHRMWLEDLPSRATV